MISSDNIKHFGPLIVVGLIFISFLLRDTEYVLLRSVVVYVAIAVGVLFVISFYVNRYR